jgi:amino acid transporter
LVSDTNKQVARRVYHPRTAGKHKERSGKLGLRESTAMAIGGMIGGGVFSVLGITIAQAGHLAFGCFLIGALLAGITARSYAKLTLRFRKSGGPFAYLRAEGHYEAAAWISWLLVLGYIFALAVYSFSFGHYLANVVGAGGMFADLAAAGMLGFFLLINLRGVTTSGLTEDVIVALKLLILFGISVLGFAAFSPDRLMPLDNVGVSGMLAASGVIFIAYEGFELLPYDYNDISNPRKTLPRALYLSVAIVAVVYVVVTIGSQMLVPDAVLRTQQEVAFAQVGQAALGAPGLWIATVGALLATTSAVNATLFSTARLVRDLSEKKELPVYLGQERGGIPVHALFWLALVGALFAMLPEIAELVSFGSLTFLVIFTLINFLQFQRAGSKGDHLLSGGGALGCGAAAAGLTYYLAVHDLPALLLAGGCGAALVVGRLSFVRLRGPVKA